MNRVRILTSAFPVWAVGASTVAYFYPQLFIPQKPGIVWLLGLVMFSMGITLTPGDFRRVIERPRVVFVGTGLQFLVMPALAWLLARAFSLPEELLVGLVLVGCSPGGTASNVICYLGRGDVALSITLTAVSTLLAVLATPALTWLYIGQGVPVDVFGMLQSIVKIVLLPVGIGVCIRSFWAAKVQPLQDVLPAFAVLAIVWIIAIIVALNRANIGSMGFAVVGAVVLHNTGGLCLGYWVARLLGFRPEECRTLSIEVGMQNSGLGVALALKHFSLAAALPGAIFSIGHNLTGSVLASLWSARARGPKPPESG